jgi:hypothetical protein
MRNKLLLSLGLLVSMSSQSAFSAEVAGVTFSGFVDAQFQSASKSPYNSSSNLNSRGFSVHDGALYITRATKNTEVKVDIPFSLRDKGGKKIGTDSTGGDVFGQNSVDFDIATVRAQAYVSHKMENGFRWKLGQFDTSYGFEVNDTVDGTFTRQGYVYNYTDPFVHTGLQLGYDMNSTMGINVLVANRKDGGLQNDYISSTSTLSKRQLQYGLQFVSTGDIRYSVGALYQSTSTKNADLYADITLGKTFGSTAVDAEMSWNNNEFSGRSTVNTIAYLLNVVHTIDSTWSAGVRGEYLKNAFLPGSAAATESAYLVFAGPQMNVSELLKLKLDGFWDSKKVVSGATAVNAYGGQIAAVHRF